MNRQDGPQKSADARTVYADIIDRPHHVSSKHPQMPRLNRAVQFAPYATLKGYGDLIRETARETDAQRLMDENEIEELNEKLVLLLQLDDPPEASFTVFVPDEKKAGGQYVKVNGKPVRYAEFEHRIILDGGEGIRIENIVEIDCDELSRSWDL